MADFPSRNDTAPMQKAETPLAMPTPEELAGFQQTVGGMAAANVTNAGTAPNMGAAPNVGAESASSAKAQQEEIQAWTDYLEVAAWRMTLRNVVLRCLLVLGVLVFLLACGLFYYWKVGQYAVVRDLTITQNPCNQGQVDIAMKVVKPGKVYCRWCSGKSQAELIDVYREAGEYTRPWSWTYQPGDSIEVSAWYRSWGLCRKKRAVFTTAQNVDIVILIDTTGSMDASLKALQEKCVAFANKLKEQSLYPRFALVGFGDTQDGKWLNLSDFTDNISKFRKSVQQLERFDGGDLPESGLDALIEAMKLVEKSSPAGNVRRFLLVSDESFHPVTADGKFDVSKVRQLMNDKGILLDVFSRPQHEGEYRKLLGEWGNFKEIENFGKVLEEGRLLEN